MSNHNYVEGDIVFNCFAGVLTYQDITDGRKWIVSLPQYPAIFKQVVDFSGVQSSTLTPQEIDFFSATRVFAKETRRAFIAPKPVTFGITREFQSYLEFNLGDGENIEIFDNQGAAVNWLNAPAEPRHPIATRRFSIPRH